jgi:hypothetical protein
MRTALCLYPLHGLRKPCFGKEIRVRAKQLLAVPALATAILTGCGSSARLSHSLATRLAAQSDQIAAYLDAGDTCGAARQASRLSREVAVSVQGSLRAELRARVAALARSIGPCIPPPQPPPANPDEHHKNHGQGKHQKEKD